MEFRNIAIIAHVDHGKTTLVDGMLHQCHAFQDHEHVAERVMDSMDLERERGITITSKNTAVFYDGVKINIVDTPGHADFGGEVERVLRMVEGALILVDAAEGPLPQTRYVLSKAMEAGLDILVCVNKIDRADARPTEVLDEIYDLFIDLDVDDKGLEFPVLWASAREGFAMNELGESSTDLRPLLDAIIEHISPPQQEEVDSSVLITNLDYDPYVGRLALGRLRGQPLRKGDTLTWFAEDVSKKVKAQLLYSWMGLRRHETTEALPGDIIALAGIEGITVGDSLVGGDDPQPMPRLTVDEPTIGMTFTINPSPFAGREGRFLTSRQLQERLERELLSNVSLRLEPGENAESFKVYGRGELQLAVLIETMRREGYELSVSRPQVVMKEDAEGHTLEPWEQVIVDVPDTAVGPVTQSMATRKGELQSLDQDGSGWARLIYRVPARALIGFRGEMLTLTRGEAVINTQFDGWDRQAGFFLARSNGALVNDRTGKTTAYALHHLEPRGQLFVGAQVEAYEGMIIGEHARENDLNVNAVKGKQLTNFRTTSADEKMTLAPPREMTLDAAIEWIDEDEWVEVTPRAIRLRKKVLATNRRSIVRRERKPKE